MEADDAARERVVGFSDLEDSLFTLGACRLPNSVAKLTQCQSRKHPASLLRKPPTYAAYISRITNCSH